MLVEEYDVFKKHETVNENAVPNKEEIIKQFKYSQEDERRTMERIYKSMGEEKLGKDVLDYLNMCLNSESMLGYLTFQEYKALVLRATDGLWTTIFLNNFDEKAPEHSWQDFKNIRHALFTTAYVYLYIVFSRVYEGKDRELKKLEIESKRPLPSFQQQ